MRAVLAAIAVSASTPVHADVIDRSLVLDAQQLRLDVTLEVSLASSPFARPTSLAPDVWFGATPRLTVGLVHSHASLDQVAAGASFCLRTADLGCDKTYRGSGVDVRYLAYRDDRWDFAPRVRFLLRDTAPLKPALALGGELRWRRGAFAIASDPYLQLGLANQREGNRAQLWLPMWLELAPSCRWLLALHTGWNSELATLGGGWHVPMALSGRFAATPHLDLALEAGFATLLGPQNNIKQRAALLTVSYRR